MSAEHNITLALDGYAPGINKLDGYVAIGSFNSAPIPVARWTGYSLSVSCPSTGTPVGTVKLQGCNDMSRNENVADALLVNWFDINSGGARIVSQAISSATVGGLSDPNAFYRWVRIAYTRSSGTITLTAKIQLKDLK